MTSVSALTMSSVSLMVFLPLNDSLKRPVDSESSDELGPDGGGTSTQIQPQTPFRERRKLTVICQPENPKGEKTKVTPSSSAAKCKRSARSTVLSQALVDNEEEVSETSESGQYSGDTAEEPSGHVCGDAPK
ncbi:MAG: hypothetical protein Q9208_007845 [Pyrenodesmia sp. 3 TL-2023]